MSKCFPAPIHVGANSTRWRLSDILAYEARMGALPDPEPLPNADERFLTAGQVAERYGVSVVTVWRWARTARGRAAA